MISPAAFAPFLRGIPSRLPMLSACLCGLALNACLENPGPDSRLNRNRREYRTIGTAAFRGAGELEFAVKDDSGMIQARIISKAHDVIDSVTWFMQIHEPRYTFDPERFQSVRLLDYIGKNTDIHPGDTVFTGPISRRTLNLENDRVQATIIRIAERDWRGHPFGGVYSGTYSARDTGSYLYTGSFEGMIDADGKFEFFLDRLSARGIKASLIGGMDDSGKVTALLTPQTSGDYITPQEVASTPFTLSPGETPTMPKVSGDFLGLPQNYRWLDSLTCTARQVDFIRE